MKLFVLLLLPLSGCAFLDQLELNEGNRRDPNKIYLENVTVQTTKREMDRYACTSGVPIICKRFGFTYDCTCHSTLLLAP